MNNDQRAKSLKTLADNQRWLEEHPTQTLHVGDLPVSDEKNAPPTDPDQQQ
jgi:hypothetical protein